MADTTQVRTLALVDVITGERRLVQTGGFPMDPSQLLPLPDVVLVVGGADGAMLFRYTAHGEVGGDSLYPSVDDARAHAAEEYGDALGEWVEVPAEAPDAHAYAVRYAADRLNSRDW